MNMGRLKEEIEAIRTGKHKKYAPGFKRKGTKRPTDFERLIYNIEKRR